MRHDSATAGAAFSPEDVAFLKSVGIAADMTVLAPARGTPASLTYEDLGDYAARMHFCGKLSSLGRYARRLQAWERDMHAWSLAEALYSILYQSAGDPPAAVDRFLREEYCAWAGLRAPIPAAYICGLVRATEDLR